jgi:hypothetical protein
MRFSVDIFSRFIDNYGDISIPLRLAHGLFIDHGVIGGKKYITGDPMINEKAMSKP